MDLPHSNPVPNSLSTYLTTGHPIILDGALATYLETLGADITSALWSASILLKNPLLIQQTHLDYFRAGANVAITASYQASVAGLREHLDLSEDDAKAVVAKSVELARQARDVYVAEASVRGNLFIAGSVGPYGAYLADGSEYTGAYNLPKEEMKDFHRGRIQALVDAGVDVLACETIPCKSEAEALLELLATEFKGTEAWFAFTLRDGTHISDGTPLADVARLFESSERVVAVGFNCVADDVGLEALRVLGTLLKRGTMVVYPNSGEQWNAKAREWEGKRTEGSTLADKTIEWWKAGAGMIGGCCRTTPEDIGVMKKALEPFN
ncbi:Homocysteine S-methyltransferase [Pyrenochaeta sp. DS3sAY3a]|nr:Homocysteine S-methyltransferase [Pyrenochaeta sp. DS3sAY3a]